jgi:hypothetical protein
MNIGALYEIKKRYWFLYPSREAASIADRIANNLNYIPNPTSALVDSVHVVGNAVNCSRYFSSMLKCNITSVSPNSIFVLLEQDGKYCNVLTANGEIGWIIHPENEDLLKGCIEEVSQFT